MNEFLNRHIGPDDRDLPEMLAAVGVSSLDELIDQTVPSEICQKTPLDLPAGEGEGAYLARLRRVAAKNKAMKSCIGLGYYDTVTPAVIQRCVLENPSWYTPYTPYQAEISQGRLEALLNFQTMVADLTGMDVANASLLDEATAAAEAMVMLHRLHGRAHRRAAAANVFLVSDRCFPQTLAVLTSRAEPLGLKLRVGQFRTLEFDETVFGALVQNPDADGSVCDLSNFVRRAHEAGVLVAVATDLLALTMISTPGEIGADVAFGSAQRFGVGMGFGGPHAAFFATRDANLREMPGRVIGVSVDRHGKRALRMALQTREQHIRRERAKSNICTAQALLANIAGFYGIYHGPEGLRDIAMRIHLHTRAVEYAAKLLGYVQNNPYFFDTLTFECPAGVAKRVHTEARKRGFNFREEEGDRFGISVGESLQQTDIEQIVEVLAVAIGKEKPAKVLKFEEHNFHDSLARNTKFMTHPVFHQYRSETAMMRYIKSLEVKDLGLDTAMIPLGSCTMKLNAAAEMMPVTWPEFSAIHPFAPQDQVKGYAQILKELSAALAEVTGFHSVSLQPNAGSQGEYTGLMVIRAYQKDRGEGERDVALIPASAHGTNPASAVMAGLSVVVVACDADGKIDFADLKAKAERHKERLSALMLTYPSTYGVFEDNVREVCAVIHRCGGQVYMDGANMNAKVGLTSPGFIGADVCHLNLHKTFAIPHGGGGPGMGPIGVAKHLAPYLPGHPLVATGGKRGISAVAAAPFGSASILLISYGYIRMLGGDGLTEATKFAILNANYVKARLESHYDVHYVGSKGRVAHELIFDLHALKEASGVDESDVAKRLMDYGFHAPTVSWPVPGTMMIEPTESEPKAELDRFCEAMIAIREEIRAIAEGRADRADNVLKNAPHTAEEIAGSSWSHPYTREQAAYPVPSLRARKFWPMVGRVDNTHGDKNLFCSCPPIEQYTSS